MTELSRVSREDLRRMMDETEEGIREIRAELDRREQMEQHEAIDALDLHMARARVNWSDVKGFFQEVLQELRGGRR